MSYSRSYKNDYLYCYGTILTDGRIAWIIHVPTSYHHNKQWMTYTNKEHAGETFIEESVQNCLERIFYLQQFGWKFQSDGIERLWAEYLKIK